MYVILLGGAAMLNGQNTAASIPKPDSLPADTAGTPQKDVKPNRDINKADVVLNDVVAGTGKVTFYTLHCFIFFSFLFFSFFSL